MVNELASSTSPYLRAHADNPVNWRMWTKENLDEAAVRDVPLLISIGYSTCHWCHVMAQESFEDEAIAEIINANFLPIKIDREELPDIDTYYMNALQAMRGQGGWPMTIFATASGSPFYAGTYFPPAPRGNLPSFTQVLTAVTQTWNERRAEVTEMTQRMDRGLADMANAVSNALPAEAAAELLSADELDEAAAVLLDSYDPAWGGFGGAPKFPPLMNLLQLMATFDRLRKSAGVGSAGAGLATTSARVASAPTSAGGTIDVDRVRDALSAEKVDAIGVDSELTGELAVDCLIAVRNTFARIASGGMRDQVRGGIARYSVDRQWFVPHFEKMLYDNALYLRAVVQWAKLEELLNPDSKWLALAKREIDDSMDFFLLDMMLGGDRYCAALDADSLNGDGVLEEGAAYVVTPEEFPESTEGLYALVNSPAGGELSGAVVAATGIMDWLRDSDADFDADHPAPWATEASEKQLGALSALRDKRPKPAVDDKTITEWNSMAITAVAEAAMLQYGATSAVYGPLPIYFWEAMHNRFNTTVDLEALEQTHEDNSIDEYKASVDADNGDVSDSVDTEEVFVQDTSKPADPVDIRRSVTGLKPGPAAGGLADWAQFVTAGITVNQLHNPGFAANAGRHSDVLVSFDGNAPTPLGLSRLGDQLVEKFIADGNSFEVFDSEGDDILNVRTSDPVDNATPSGRSAAAETMLLLGELGGSRAEDGLSTSRALETRDKLIGVYRALAGRAPRGCGYALWQAERALNPIRVASIDTELVGIAARHPSVTLITETTGVPDGQGHDIEVPEGSAIVCRGTQCSLPVTSAEDLLALLDS